MCNDSTTKTSLDTAPTSIETDEICNDYISDTNGIGTNKQLSTSPQTDKSHEE